MATPVQRVFNLLPAAETLAGGKDPTPGYGMRWQVTYTGSIPNVGETWKILLADGQTNTTITIGAGDGAGLTPSFCYTYHGKEYILSMAKVLFSAKNDPLIYNDTNGLGNGFVEMDNQTAVPEDLTAIAPFQGKLLFLARRSVQVWAIDDDPGLWQFVQAVSNIGTIAKDSVRATGDIDVLFLADVGIASIRAREVTGNAFVDDLGAAIASLVKAKIASDPEAASNACAVIEPSTGQYWVFIKDTIYVFSYYPSSKVAAWSTYTCVDSDGNTFVPEKFVVFQGQVFCRSGNTIYAFGGSTGQIYDSTLVEVETPWMDLKTPGHIKQAVSLNAALSGPWRIYFSAAVDSQVLNTYPAWDGHDKHTFDQGIVPLNGEGSHMKFRLTSQAAGPAIFSSFNLHYELGQER